jgi:hypothetical protein
MFAAIAPGFDIGGWRAARSGSTPIGRQCIFGALYVFKHIIKAVDRLWFAIAL